MVQLFPDKRQTMRDLCRGWVWSGRVGRCSREWLGGSTTLLRIVIFPPLATKPVLASGEG